MTRHSEHFDMEVHKLRSTNRIARTNRIGRISCNAWANRVARIVCCGLLLICMVSCMLLLASPSETHAASTDMASASEVAAPASDAALTCDAAPASDAAPANDAGALTELSATVK